MIAAIRQPADGTESGLLFAESNHQKIPPKTEFFD